MMKHALITLLIIGASSMTTSSTVFADGHDASETERSGDKRHGGRSGRMLEKVDTNKDGKVDLSEYMANAEQRFNKMDLNSDGYITLEEGKKMHQEMRAKHKELRKKHREEHKELRRKQREELKADSSN